MNRNRIQAGRAIADQRAFDRKLAGLFAASLPRKAMVRAARPLALATTRTPA